MKLRTHLDLINIYAKNRIDEIKLLDSWLTESTAWTTAPASSKTSFHSAHKGGLLKHSIIVTETLLKLVKILDPNIDEESCIIVGLYHDCGKVGSYDEPYYIRETSSWHREKLGQMYVTNENLTHIDVPTRSLVYVSKFVNLTDEEMQAIRYHDGQYVNENKSVAHKETRLTRLLQFADQWAAGVLEKE